MAGEAWCQHIEEGGFTRPSRGGNKAVWQEEIRWHRDQGCRKCQERATSRKRENARLAREEAYKSNGMQKYRVNGQTIWE